MRSELDPPRTRRRKLTFASIAHLVISGLILFSGVAGAVAGGGLTVIANAPNPAGQSILKHHFDGAVSPKNLLNAALMPTIILWLCLAML